MSEIVLLNKQCLQIVLKCLPSRDICIAVFAFPSYEICVILVTDNAVESSTAVQFYYCMNLSYGNVNLIWQTWDKIILCPSIDFSWVMSRFFDKIKYEKNAEAALK